MSDNNIAHTNSTIENRRRQSSVRYQCPYKRGPHSTPARVTSVSSHFERLSEVSDVYRSVLGPTTDETILAGLQTVMDMCLTHTTYTSQTDYSSGTNISGRGSSAAISDSVTQRNSTPNIGMAQQEPVQKVTFSIVLLQLYNNLFYD